MRGGEVSSTWTWISFCIFWRELRRAGVSDRLRERLDRAAQSVYSWTNVTWTTKPGEGSRHWGGTDLDAERLPELQLVFLDLDEFGPRNKEAVQVSTSSRTWL